MADATNPSVETPAVAAEVNTRAPAIAETVSRNADVTDRWRPALSATSDSHATTENEDAVTEPVIEEPVKPEVVPEELVPDSETDKAKRAEAAMRGEITKERNRRRAAEEAATAAKADREADRARIDKLAAAFEKLTATQQAAEPRPDRTKFDTPTAYEDALLSWNETQIVAREAAKAADAAKAEQDRLALEAQNARIQETYKTIQEAHVSRQTAFMEAHPDYEEVAMAMPADGGPTISDAAAAAIMQVDNGPEVAYWLGKNIAESERISGLHPIQQAIAIGRLSATLTLEAQHKAAEETRRAISRAPATVKPPGSNSTATAKSLDDMSPDEYAAHMNAREFAARQAARPMRNGAIVAH